MRDPAEQEPEASLGGQAFWSFGGLFLIDSPEQRRLRVRDSRELALQDWMGSAAFDRPEDEWPRRWAEAYVDFAAGEKRAWLHAQGVRWLPFVQWAERGGYQADVAGTRRAAHGAIRGEDVARDAVNAAGRRAQARHAMAEAQLDQALGDTLANPPLEGLDQPRPGAPGDVEARHGVAMSVASSRSAPRPSSSLRRRRAHHAQRSRALVVPAQPAHHRQRVRPLGLRAESRPDRTRRPRAGAPRAPERRDLGRRFAKRCPDFLYARTVPELVRATNELQGGEPLIDAAELEHVIVERDRQVASGLGKGTRR